MKTITFKNGDKMPLLGLGTWKSETGEVYDAVRQAIRIGFRHIDCAAIYANEKEIGQAFHDAFSDGDVQREDLWITSKLWNSSHKKGQVMPAFQKTLDDLQLEYLDLYLVHWPVVLKDGVSFPTSGADFLTLDEVPITETWQAMEACVDTQKTHHIGVSNFSIKKIGTLLQTARIVPEMNQVEMHPLLQQNELLDYCKSHSIPLTAYSPLGSPDRADSIKQDNEPGMLDHPVIVNIAENHGCTSAQILIAWAMDRGTSVIPKSVNPGRLQLNFEAQNIHLTEDDRTSIAAMDRHYRYVTGTFWAVEGSGYTVEELWDER